MAITTESSSTTTDRLWKGDGGKGGEYTSCHLTHRHDKGLSLPHYLNMSYCKGCKQKISVWLGRRWAT
jgi:hypothetical protein